MLYVGLIEKVYLSSQIFMDEPVTCITHFQGASAQNQDTSVEGDDPEIVVGNYTEIQEILFGSLFEYIAELQRNISSSKRVIIYKINPESGLGNMVVGLVSSLVAALATGRGIQSSHHSLVLR